MSNYAFDRKPYMPTTSSCLVGPRAESISMSCEQWFEVVGYMARPGRVSSFEAEIPKDRPVVIYCAFGGQSLLAARGLAGRGYDAVNALGGLHYYRGKYYVGCRE